MLVVAFDIDAIVLVDGGTDILPRGAEERLGTPEEDMTSLAAYRIECARRRVRYQRNPRYPYRALAALAVITVPFMTMGF